MHNSRARAQTHKHTHTHSMDRQCILHPHLKKNQKKNLSNIIQYFVQAVDLAAIVPKS